MPPWPEKKLEAESLPLRTSGAPGSGGVEEKTIWSQGVNRFWI